ncbi:triose-phosphate isomerase [Paraliomyxa miuraensis]|uniref:triose-phosphate isomerase n=1 Tax=Paraliomyxa miuraensis TaxID=376150 RepID=UPI002250B989|nr:triose-phosphate isomerase [Paraliomyxa miuraensis]MCX4244695.1 triose-phosphate isomerase [Paraliomyxa miuraensis]
MHRVTWVLGNWKQNHRPAAAKVGAEAIADGVAEALSNPDPTAGEVRVGIAPPYLSLEAVRPYTRLDDTVVLLAQDCAAQDEGAFTGEVGPAMLRDAEVEGAIIGHSERRAYFHEDDALIAAKLRAVLEGGLVCVLCVGEALEARDAGEHESTVISQLSGAFSNVGPELVNERLVIAYEPVWAIGTGRNATPEQAAQMHATIRRWMGERFGSAGADRSILYGGSVKPGNASALIAAGEVDGFLVGGASLDPTSFLAIVRAAATTARPTA